MSVPFEVADALRVCLESALNTRPQPPASVCLRAGETVPFNVSTTQDECCSGLGWVRVVSITPNPSRVSGNEPIGCSVSAFVVEFEMGVARCAPTPDASAIPTCEQWTNLAFLMDEDAAAMREAVCCYSTTILDDPIIEVARIGTWTPLDISGGCAGGSMTVLVSFDCLDCI